MTIVAKKTEGWGCRKNIRREKERERERERERETMGISTDPPEN